MVAFVVVYAPQANAQSDQGNFSLQVTPSPLVISIKPGESSTSELKIRNTGNKIEYLKIEPKSFNIKNDTGDVTLSDNAPSDIANWVSFSAPTFSILPGEWFTERITFSLPKDSGFSYSFALVISRQNDKATAKPGISAIKGSVAVFTLIAVDRPGAKREVEIVSFESTRRVYEYLPAEFKTTLKNTGNTIVQPYGNIFIQRSKDDNVPISTLPVNEGKGYILPGSSRTLTTMWSAGFPSYVATKDAANSKENKKLKWNWNDVANFRFGRYTAKLVAVYNDGTRDVPIEAQVSFWVVPWKILIGTILVCGLLVIGIFTIIKKSFLAAKRTKHKHDSNEKTDTIN